MPKAISSPGTNLSSPLRQYSSTPSNPVGSSRAKSDVPTAVLGSSFPITISAGTITSPPPIPNIPLRTPAQPPSRSTQTISVQPIDGSLLTQRQDRPKLWQGLLTLPLGRPKVSNHKPGGRPTVQQTAGSGDPRRTANLKSGSYFRPVPQQRLRSLRKQLAKQAR